MSADFSFSDTLSDFKSKISEGLSETPVNIDQFIAVYKSAAGSDADKRSASDQALRNMLSILLRETKEKERPDEDIAKDALDIITSTVLCAKQGMCSASIPFVLLGDLLDCLTLDVCDPVFRYIEERVGTWKSPQFYQAGKNYLLRMCNDLLRRLSQAQNTVFCGRIQLFLARLFPLSEKSALNLVSQFNSDNITIFNENPSESILKKKTEPKHEATSSEKVVVDIKPQKDELWLDGSMEGMEVDQQETPTLDDERKEEDQSTIVDYELYHSIWSLQDVFRSPLQCYTQESWDRFVKNADSVLSVFMSFKLDKQHFTEQQNKVYFAKFLTSEKLINLQLNDSMFRRQLLCQFLILFQYLSGEVKFRSHSAVLSEVQAEWIKLIKHKIYRLLEETPPDGKSFSTYIKHLLSREEFWIKWKNEGCTSFIKVKENEKKENEKPEKPLSPPAKKRKMTDAAQVKTRSSVADDFISGKSLGMGSPELTRLWELCPDNLVACKSEKRRFLPTLESFFADAVEFINPKNMVEEEYMPYNDSNFQWKALRLLSQRSPLFFASQPAPLQFKIVPQYLKGVIEKLSKEFPQNSEPSDIIQENGEIDKEMDEEDQSIQEEDEKVSEKMDQGENDTEENDAEEDDDEVLEDDDIDNDDELLNDDSQHEGDDVDSDDEGLLEPVPATDSLSSDEITTVAQKLAADWEKLAPFLDLKLKDMEEIKGDSEDVVLQARQTLVTWQDRNRSAARRPALIQALTNANMEHLVKEISK